MATAAAIILAAGKGTRMKSELPKVLHEVCGRPMLSYVMDVVKRLRLQPAVVVVGHKAQMVRRALEPGTTSVLQKQLRGTADAVKQALGTSPSRRNTGLRRGLLPASGTVVILYGDTPLLRRETVQALLRRHKETGALATILTAVMKDATGYGRIVRDAGGAVAGIVEEKEADAFQKDIKEINTGIIAFDLASLRRAIPKIKANNRKKEFYLTDVIGLFVAQNGLVESLEVKDPEEALGVNSRVELAQANSSMNRRLCEKLMKGGVTVIDPVSLSLAWGASVGRDSTIYPFTVIEKDVKIGKSCSIGPFVRVRQGTRLPAFSSTKNHTDT